MDNLKIRVRAELENMDEVFGVIPNYEKLPYLSTLELAGVKKPEHVQFKSVLPILNGEKKQQYDAIYGGYLNVQRSATIDGWKLILYPNIKKVRLFNTNDDPMEMKDLGDAKAQQGRIKTLFAKLLELQKQTGDKLDLKSVYPNL